MYAHENVVNLTRYALPLEEFVRQEEERSARLAATLLPQYHANGEHGDVFSEPHPSVLPPGCSCRVWDLVASARGIPANVQAPFSPAATFATPSSSGVLLFFPRRQQTT